MGGGGETAEGQDSQHQGFFCVKVDCRCLQIGDAACYFQEAGTQNSGGRGTSRKPAYKLSENGKDNDIAANLHEKEKAVQDNPVQPAAERISGDCSALRNTDGLCLIPMGKVCVAGQMWNGGKQ